MINEMTNCLGRYLTVLGWNSLRAPCGLPLINQTRNTFILQRRHPPGLTKKNRRRPKLCSRHYVYDLVENTNHNKLQKLNVILTTYVQGLGDKGDMVKVKQNYAYDELLLPGLAVYSSPENIKIYAEESKNKQEKPKFSSRTAEVILGILSRRLVSVVMNKETEWTLEPWHVRMSFRKAGIIVPESAIEIPKEPITGPNLDLEMKDFNVTITLNKTEKVAVRCRIHHWSTNPGDRLPYVKYPWREPAELLFPEMQEN